MSTRTAETTKSTRSPAFSKIRSRTLPNGHAHSFNANQMKVIAELALMECKGGHATAKWQRQIQSIDRSGRLSKGALLLLQQLQARLGIPTTRPIALPVDDQPFWHRTQRPFADYRSTEELPSWADVVIIGAGLTGAAAAYHLKDARLNVVIIEKGDPAGEASGRNGGNFELLPENSVGTYEGLAPGWKSVTPTSRQRFYKLSASDRHPWFWDSHFAIATFSKKQFSTKELLVISRRRDGCIWRPMSARNKVFATRSRSLPSMVRK